jgi:hypothetical protein
MNIKTLTLTFEIPLPTHQLQKWRGAMAEHAGWSDDTFHNHAGAKEKVLYRYPSVQYRSINGKAALFAVEGGVEAVQDMLMRSDGTLHIGGEVYKLRIDAFDKKDYPLSILPQKKSYFLKNWLALNDQNYREWSKMASLQERTAQLEQILASNIISFAKGIHWQLPERLEVTLLNIQATHTLKHKGVPMVAFDVSFAANIDLPIGLGLGKACSHGFGVVMPLLENREMNVVKKRPRIRSSVK